MVLYLIPLPLHSHGLEVGQRATFVPRVLRLDDFCQPSCTIAARRCNCDNFSGYTE